MNTDFPLFPEQASSIAQKIDLLYLFLWTVSGFFTLLIFVLIVFFAIKYRRRSASDRPAPIEGSVKLELLWTIVPLLISMVIFVWGAKLYVEIYADPVDALDVHVIGKQWMWKIQHPDGKREINSLHVPEGQRVQLTMASQDVIHSFFIPAFRVKQDVLPGRYTKISFIPTKVGEYHLFCAEYCGNEHSGMIGKVVVMTQDDYQAWLTGAETDVPPKVSGERLFTSMGCMTCHGSQAPSMSGLFGSTVQLADGRTVKADEHYIRESIIDSTAKIVAGYKPIMPSFRNQISEEALIDLVAYVKSLKEVKSEPVAAPEPGTATQP
jgi:cytochrome c oxidase subunit 2